MSALAMILTAAMVATGDRPEKALADSPSKTRTEVKKNLEVLKKKLLPVANRWSEDRDIVSGGLVGKAETEVKLARLIAPAKAKITVQFKATLHGKRAPQYDWMLSIYLGYYDGRWTTTGHGDLPGDIPHLDRLMLAIDKIGDE